MLLQKQKKVLSEGRREEERKSEVRFIPNDAELGCKLGKATEFTKPNPALDFDVHREISS